MTESTAETKTQRVERLKRERNPWEQPAEIRGFAKDANASVPREWLNTYFR